MHPQYRKARGKAVSRAAQICRCLPASQFVMVCTNLLLKMPMSQTETEAAQRAAINSETAKIAWRELQRFFAQGNAIRVSPELDLVEVAYRVSIDDAIVMEDWLATGQVDQVSDAQALEWLELDALMWSVVVRPWVLVQPVVENNKVSSSVDSETEE